MKTAYRFPIYLLITIFTYAFLGCENMLDEYLNEKQMAPKKLLCRTWVKTDETHTPANVIPNLFISYLPCAKDNAYKYDSDGHFEMNQGNSSCYATQPFVMEAGNWELLQNDTKLKTTVSGNKTRLYTIVLLDTNYNFVTTYIDSSTPTRVLVKEKFSPQ